jgi:xanthine dehydrogenase molybdenum-binding subunit
MSGGFSVVGKRMPRKDARDIVTGKAEFIDDLRIPEMLYAKVLRSPLAHANILDIETEDAERLPGVKAVLTHRNVPPWMGGTPPHMPVLDRKVRFVGDAVALVAAESEAAALEALDLIRVTYEELPAVFDVEAAIRPGAPRLYDQFPENRLPLEFPDFGPDPLNEVVMGDVEKGFSEADVVCEESCAYEGIANPLPPEPPGLIVRWEAENRLTVWSASQSPSMQRWMMQLMMGFPDIRSIGTCCGGSYGSKNFYVTLFFHAAALSKAAGRPVKLYYTKAEQMAAFVLRPSSRLHCRVGLKRDGTVTAVEGEWLAGTGASSSTSQGQMCVGCAETQLAVRCENWRLKTQCIVTNRNPSGPVRGFGGQELKSALWPVLSAAMEKIDIDPLEFYKKNYVKTGDRYLWRDRSEWVCRVDYRKAMDRGAEAFGWRERWKGWLQPTAVDGPRRIGVGVGIHGNADVGEDRSEAYVRLSPDGTAVIHANVAEFGAGQRSNLCKMAAEVLGLPLEKVDMTPPDTRVTPFDFGLIGSRGTYANGSAVIRAAEDAREKLLETAAKRMGAPAEALETAGGLVFAKDAPEKKIPWIGLFGPTMTFTGFGCFEPDHSVPNFLLQFVEVAVDTDTGMVDLIRIAPVTDAGKVIDPATVEGQLYGCLGSAGIDTAIFEETILDPRTGHILNTNLIDYKWRTFSQLPVCDNVICESELPTHRFKAVGVGEIAPSPGPSAVLMAASNAIGVRLREYPLTPDRILRALGKVKGGKA